MFTYDGTNGAGRLPPVGVGLGPILDGTVGAALDGAPGAGLWGIDGFVAGPDLDPGTDLGDGGLSKHSNVTANVRVCQRKTSRVVELLTSNTSFVLSECVSELRP